MLIIAVVQYSTCTALALHYIACTFAVFWGCILRHPNGIIHHLLCPSSSSSSPYINILESPKQALNSLFKTILCPVEYIDLIVENFIVQSIL
ncbi:unnamed protein product [Brugia timori]|uniref:Secreted protein n=1 Tax=Brugia timori TaxID=42155 RepID=A0A0R3RB53_9BILA|nr:unnamed protein product [Brugia timori]